jgi:phosphate/sulfate permease
VRSKLLLKSPHRFEPSLLINLPPPLLHLPENSWPVSTTYSIVSALAGVGVAVGGKDAVQWGWNDGKGLGAIFAGFVLAPAIAAGFAGIVFLITKFGILKRKNSTRAALIASPVYFFTGSSFFLFRSRLTPQVRLG